MRSLISRIAEFALIPSVLTMSLLSACSFIKPGSEPFPEETETPEEDFSRYLTGIEDEPDTVDFQCTTIHYTIALNVFNRLVECENDKDGDLVISPSLAESWTISDDGRIYHFNLRDHVSFSNGCALTSEDVEYTFTRLLTHPDSANRDIVEIIDGAWELEGGEADYLEGFRILNEREFEITLEQPFEGFLACLSMSGASILDKETTIEAGERFGKDPEWTIGTGWYTFSEWRPGDRMILKANKNCWAGAPANDGLCLLFLNDPEEIRILFEEGKLDVLNLDEVGNAAEFFMHGNIYKDSLQEVRRLGITYIALNETVPELRDRRVRLALQRALNRPMLLEAVYSGRGRVENGIFPEGLYGHNPDLPEIPYDPERAQELLAEAGYPNGFSMQVYVKASSTQWEMVLLRLAASMWEKIGVRAKINVISDEEFMSRRKSGDIDCYSAMWSADYNDPDNFIYTFFGNRSNTTSRSLCYPREEIMFRVRQARVIHDPEARIAEYQDLERIIIQEDAAWIPLFQRRQYYVTSARLRGFSSDWMGSVKNRYRVMSVSENQEGTEERS